jgi:hypothetical protein
MIRLNRDPRTKIETSRRGEGLHTHTKLDGYRMHEFKASEGMRR